MRRIAEAYCETRTGLALGPGLGPVQNSDSRKTRPRLIKKLNSKLDSLKFYTRFQNYATEEKLVANVSFMKRTAINSNDERKYIFKLYFCNNYR